MKSLRIVSLVLMLMLTGCVTVRTPGEKEWPMLTEEGIVAGEKAFLQHRLFQNIDLGMTKKEILECCGKPQKISKAANGEIWFWNVTTFSSSYGSEHEVNIKLWKVRLYFNSEGILYSAQVE